MLEDFFGVKANDDLIKLALTHPSYTKENNLDELANYERLEFFGDSVLKLFSSKILYEKYPDYSEGKLSKIRSILVSDAILSKIAFEINLDKIIILGKAEEKQGGRIRESNLACSLEAIFGAYYLSHKIDVIEQFLIKYFAKYVDDIDKHFEKYNAKDVLQQYTQSIDKTLPVYTNTAVEGPAHAPVFKMQVAWQGKVLATEEGKTKKDAQQNCAYSACKKLGILD